MTTEREAMAALLQQAKHLVMENFDFDRAVRIMEAAEFGWAAFNTSQSKVDHARGLLSDLIDNRVRKALEHIDRGEDWDFLWTSCGGFFVTLSRYGIIQAHLSLESSDSYDWDELTPFYDQLAAARGLRHNAPPHHAAGGRVRRILRLTE
jgi:hypothetical protein